MKTILVIGAGRSGSTLLSKVLNAHPRISFHGETDFLVPRLWNEVWLNRFWLHWDLHAGSGATSSISRRDGVSFLDLRGELDQDAPGEILAAARERAARAVREAVLRILDVERKTPLAWGFKEPWNGSDDFLYDWSLYDEVFPDAIWVHLVRHPLAYAQSVSQWNKTELNLETLTRVLAQWVGVVRHSRARAGTGRFFEIRFEDLVESPRPCLAPILAASEVEWDDGCLEPLRTRVMQSQADGARTAGADLSAAEIQRLSAAVAGFGDLCRELRYDAPEARPNYFRAYPTVAKPSAWVMAPANRASQRVATQAALAQCETELQAARAELAVARALLRPYESSRAIQLALALKRAGRRVLSAVDLRSKHRE